MPTNADISVLSGASRRNRLKIAELQEQANLAMENGMSQRGFSKNAGIPRTTLQHWANRKESLTMSPAALEFFESPDGVEFLHRLVVVLHLVVNWMGTGGLRLIGLIIELCRLGGVIATSYGVHQRLSSQMHEHIVEYGEQEKQRLAADMPHRTITTAEDETFLSAGMSLVAIEPVSGFILAEQYEQKRDAESWNTVLKRPLLALM